MFRVLVVDDNPADVDLLLECLRRADIEYTVAPSGVRALEALRDETRTSIGLVLLDLNLPGMTGHDILKEIKTDQRLRRTPVIVLSHSDIAKDVGRAYDLGANCYIKKPSTLEGLERVVHHIEDFWLGLAQLPTQEQLST